MGIPMSYSRLTDPTACHSIGSLRFTDWTVTFDMALLLKPECI